MRVLLKKDGISMEIVKEYWGGLLERPIRVFLGTQTPEKQQGTDQR